MPIHHFVVNLVIRKDNRILLEKRNDSGSNWKFPGGHVNDDENILDACKREALEELGVNIKFFTDETIPNDIPGKILFLPNPQRVFVEYKDKDSGSNSPHTNSGMVFFVSTEDEPAPIEKQIIRWFNIDELKAEKDILEQVRVLAMKALGVEIRSLR